MDETSAEPLMTRRFLRRYAARIVIGAILVAIVYGCMTVAIPSLRDRRIARQIIALGGDASFHNGDPDWIPHSMQSSLPFLARLTNINLENFDLTDEAALSDLLSEIGSLHRLDFLDLSGTRITDMGLVQLKGLTNLETLKLSRTEVTDGGLKHLKGLARLDWLDLSNSQVTDAGLEHLTAMTSLKLLELNETQTTAEGRALIRKALPGCQIVP